MAQYIPSAQRAHNHWIVPRSIASRAAAEMSSSPQVKLWDNKRGKVLTRQRRPRSSRLSVRFAASGADENGTGGPYSTQSRRRLNDLLTVQAVKTLLIYLQETNGESHLFLHEYLVNHPLPATDDEHGAEQWLADLACTPLTLVSDPRRSSVCGPAGEETYLRGKREVSPRDIAERVLALRASLAVDFINELEKVPIRNSAILRRALTQSFAEPDATSQHG